MAHARGSPVGHGHLTGLCSLARLRYPCSRHGHPPGAGVGRPPLLGMTQVMLRLTILGCSPCRSHPWYDVEAALHCATALHSFPTAIPVTVMCSWACTLFLLKVPVDMF